MNQLPDDLLVRIIDRVDDTNDRKSLSLVNKRCLRLEGINRSSLVVHHSENLANFLPRFPNLLSFQVRKIIPNHLVQFVADTCPKIQVFNLNYNEWHVSDIDDAGLAYIAKKCPDLEKVNLTLRYGIGNLGVASLGEFSAKLKTLDLSSCIKVSDGALASIADLTNLEVLILEGCFLITDQGLEFLGEGYVCNTLKVLSLAECGEITDDGLMNLEHMACLKDLNLSECGHTHNNILKWDGEMIIEFLYGLRRLNLSNLDSVSDKTMINVARYCWKLEALDLSGCVWVTGAGIRAFANHKSLKKLVLRRCVNNIGVADIQELVVGCSSLECIVLDESLKTLMPLSVQENLGKYCVLKWK